MIQADLGLDDRGVIRILDVRGHSGYGRPGSDVVCSAVTVLSRTLVRLYQTGGFGPAVQAPGPGALLMRLDQYDPARAHWAAGAGAAIIQGLRDVASEYPENFSVKINEFEE